jgi:subtilase family serine protease
MSENEKQESTIVKITKTLTEFKELIAVIIGIVILLSSSNIIPNASSTLTIYTFEANPEEIKYKDGTELSWRVSESATEISIDQGVGEVPIEGTRTVNPDETTTIYTLTVSNAKKTETLQITVRMISEPDLTINRVILVPSAQITEDTQVTIGAIVENIGDGPAPPSVLSIFIQGFKEEPYNYDIDALEPDETETVTWTGRLPAHYNYKMTITIDRDDEVNESDEDNNIARQVFSVSG